MEVSQGRISAQGKIIKRTGRDARTFLAVVFCSAVALAGCLHWPDVATECDAYGVMENHEPMGTVVIAEPLFRDQLDVQCANIKEAAAEINPNAQVSGCVISQDDGIVRAYYWTGDKCALNHELCHAAHGPEHTEQYLADLESGVPMPYCPENQLWPKR